MPSTRLSSWPESSFLGQSLRAWPGRAVGAQSIFTQKTADGVSPTPPHSPSPSAVLFAHLTAVRGLAWLLLRQPFHRRGFENPPQFEVGQRVLQPVLPAEQSAPLTTWTRVPCLLRPDDRPAAAAAQASCSLPRAVLWSLCCCCHAGRPEMSCMCGSRWEVLPIGALGDSVPGWYRGLSHRHLCLAQPRPQLQEKAGVQDSPRCCAAPSEPILPVKDGGASPRPSARAGLTRPRPAARRAHAVVGEGVKADFPAQPPPEPQGHTRQHLGSSGTQALHGLDPKRAHLPYLGFQQIEKQNHGRETREERPFLLSEKVEMPSRVRARKPAS